MKNAKLVITFLFLCCYGVALQAQINARMLRYPDVSETHITFTYAGDIWVVAKEGGLATKLSSPEGSESFPRFSPDGSQIAFSGNYDGNLDVYTIPTTGGIPSRLTYHGFSDYVIDWNPDGKSVIFSSRRTSGRQRYDQFFEISTNGGLAEKLAVPYGEYGCPSPNGKKFVYTDKSQATSTWKRYRGGSAADLFVFDLESMSC